MGAHYIMDVSDSSDATAKLAQMKSEQETLISALGLVLDDGDGSKAWRFTRIDESNGFTVYGNANGTSYAENENGIQISGATSSTNYHHFLFTEKSIMIVITSSQSPNSMVSAIYIITKNDDGQVVFVCTYTYSSTPRLFVKEKNLGAVANIPVFSQRDTNTCSNFAQIALANIPMQMPGKLCDNVFTALCVQTTPWCDLAVINGVEYAVATMYSTYACR